MITGVEEGVAKTLQICDDDKQDVEQNWRIVGVESRLRQAQKGVTERLRLPVLRDATITRCPNRVHFRNKTVAQDGCNEGVVVRQHFQGVIAHVLREPLVP